MSTALSVTAHRSYPERILYGKCPHGPISNVFEVPAGYHAQLTAYDIPDDWCVTFEEGVCLCCCDIQYYPVPGGCGGSLTFDMSACEPGGNVLCLPAGRFRALVEDEDGDPVTPGPMDVVIKVNILPGPCP